MVNLQTLAWPRRQAPKPRTGLSLSCLMLLSWTRATIVFSSRTASFLIAAIASSTVLSAKDPPAFRVMSLRRFSSQHSKSWITLSFPDIFVASTYSFQCVWKYVQSSLVPAAEIVGRRTFSILAAIVCCFLLACVRLLSGQKVTRPQVCPQHRLCRMSIQGKGSGTSA